MVEWQTTVSGVLGSIPASWLLLSSITKNSSLSLVILGWVDVFFFDCSSPFRFLIEYHCTFPISYKNTSIVMFIIIVFLLGSDWPSGLFYRARFTSSSVSLSYFILTVPMHEYLGKHWYMNSPFPITILSGTFFFRQTRWSFWSTSRLSKINWNNKIIYHGCYRGDVRPTLCTINWVQWSLWAAKEASVLRAV